MTGDRRTPGLPTVPLSWHSGTPGQPLPCPGLHGVPGAQALL